MAAPTVRGVGTPAAGTGDIAPGLPAGTAQNDILLLFTESRAINPEPAAPAGWAHVTGSSVEQAASPNTRLSVMWKRAGASESAPTVVDVGNHLVGVIVGFSGCITSGNPWDVIATGLDPSGADTSVLIPGNTTTVADCLVVAAFVTAFDISSTAQVSGWANADLSSVTERVDFWSDVGTGGGIGVATGEKATAGAFGDTTATLANGALTATMSLALKPAAGGTTHETASWQSSFTTKARVTQSWQSSYTAKARAASAWASSYTVRAHQQTTWQSAYGVDDYQLVTWGSSFTVRGHVTATWASSYDVETLGSTHEQVEWGSSWVTKASVGASWQSSYTVRDHVTVAWQSAYGVDDHQVVTWGSSFAVRAHATAEWPSSFLVGQVVIPELTSPLRATPLDTPSRATRLDVPARAVPI